MYLIDTNLWIEHFQRKSDIVSMYLGHGDVVTHDFIIGELSLGSFNKKDRSKTLERLKAISKIETSSRDDILSFIEEFNLQTTGIGYVDVHLLHACKKNSITLVTLDKNLKKQADKIGIKTK